MAPVNRPVAEVSFHNRANTFSPAQIGVEIFHISKL